MNIAYNEADNMKVDGRRISVDYERAMIYKDLIPKIYIYFILKIKIKIKIWGR